jgi:hypothetical protein
MHSDEMPVDISTATISDSPTEHEEPTIMSDGREQIRGEAITGPVEGFSDPLAQQAYYGIVGETVRTIEPHTEADPAALLVMTLVGCGAALGRLVGSRPKATHIALQSNVCAPSGRDDRLRLGAALGCLIGIACLLAEGDRQAKQLGFRKTSATAAPVLPTPMRDHWPNTIAMACGFGIRAFSLQQQR